MIELKKTSRKGFTLIELMIVVVIVTVLAGAVLPLFIENSDDAKEAALEYDLQVLQKQITRFHIDHNGIWPTLAADSLPQLLNTTHVDGRVGTGSEYIYGPYIIGNEFPYNPVNGYNAVKKVTAMPKVVASGNYGWVYNEDTGEILPNTSRQLLEYRSVVVVP